MFKFVPGQVRHAWWPVSWNAATEEGEVVTNRIEMRFVLHTDAEYQTLITERAAELDKAWAGLTGAEREAAQAVARAGYVAELATAWRGIADEAGAPLGWSPDALAAFLQLPGVSTAVLSAHAAARAGERPNG